MRGTTVVQGLLAGLLLVSAGCGGTQPEEASEATELGTTAQAVSTGPMRWRDINTRPALFPRLGGSNGSTALSSTVSLFVAHDELRGEELWRSDGTEAGTSLVKELVPGVPGLADTFAPRMRNVQGTVFFVAQGDVMEQALWKTNGTAAGTVQVKRFPARFDEPNPIEALTHVGGTVFFVAERQLWQSNGTTAGTVALQSLAPPGDAFRYHPRELLPIDNTLFFTAVSAGGSLELWKRDVLSGGTVLLQTFTSFPAYEPVGLTQVGTTLFFRVGRALWKSDGTTTTQVSMQSGSISELVAINSTLFFTSSGALWMSDGTTATQLRSFSERPRGLMVHNGALYFVANDVASGSELWTSNGTTAGTLLVKDLVPGPGGSAPGDLLSWNGGLYFKASVSAGTRGLYRGDGLVNGAVVALKTWAEQEASF
ncbi:MAG TPA: ELWxxDGT repeat protein, partial [Myxococcaceae bacterium]